MKEWQVLLETLSRSYMTRLMSPSDFSDAGKAKYNIDQANALADVDVMLATRIFIADDVQDLNLRKDGLRW